MPNKEDEPTSITTEEQLDELLGRPYPALTTMMQRVDGDFAILGIAGKMGMSLGAAAARAIRAAGVTKKVYGVSRFSNPGAMQQLETAGITPIRCDLLDRTAVANLPPASNVIFMAGRKCGTSGEDDLTWVMNTLVPAHVCEHFATALFEPVLTLASETIDAACAARGRRILKVAGVCGPTPQAVREAAFAQRAGYHACLLSLAALKDANVDALAAHCREVSRIMPLIGFYLQPGANARHLVPEPARTALARTVRRTRSRHGRLPAPDRRRLRPRTPRRMAGGVESLDGLTVCK